MLPGSRKNKRESRFDLATVLPSVPLRLSSLSSLATLCSVELVNVEFTLESFKFEVGEDEGGGGRMAARGRKLGENPSSA